MEQKQTVETEEQFLTPAEVAAELHISPSAVYALIRIGDIQAVNLASVPNVRGRGLYCIRRRWMDEFVARRFVVAAAPEPARVQCDTRRTRYSGRLIPNHLGL